MMERRPRCNDKVMADTIAETGESKTLIEHAIKFQNLFIAARIGEGSWESVRVTGFGNFRPKFRSVQWRDFMRTLPPPFKKLMKQR